MDAAPLKGADLRQMRERGGRHTRCGIPPDDDNAAAQICPLQGDGFLCRRPYRGLFQRRRSLCAPIFGRPEGIAKEPWRGTLGTRPCERRSRLCATRLRLVVLLVWLVTACFSPLARDRRSLLGAGKWAYGPARPDFLGSPPPGAPGDGWRSGHIGGYPSVEAPPG